MLQLGNNVADGKVTESFVLRFEDMEKINAFRGDRVKALRDELGWTLKDFSENVDFLGCHCRNSL